MAYIYTTLFRVVLKMASASFQRTSWITSMEHPVHCRLWAMVSWLLPQSQQVIAKHVSHYSQLHVHPLYIADGNSLIRTPKIDNRQTLFIILNAMFAFLNQDTD